MQLNDIGMGLGTIEEFKSKIESSRNLMAV